MKTIIKNYALLLLLCLLDTSTLRAQAQHWQFDPYAWEYDMTAYVQLKVNGQTVSNYADYEVAAFCGNECRGVAKVLTMEDETTLLYLRIRSKSASNETISFRIYQASADKETQLEETLEFKSQTLAGAPSAPMVLKLVNVLPGDVNGDGNINVTDVGMVIDHILENTPANFVKAAADVNGDNQVNVTDVGLIIDIILNDGADARLFDEEEHNSEMLDPQ